MNNNNELVLERIFDAPLELVWDACVDEQKFSQWWGQPEEGEMTYFTMDFRVNGSMHFKVNLGSTEVWVKSIFKEIVPMERLVIEDFYSDVKGTLIDNVEFPKSTIILTLEGIGEKTKMVVRHTGIGTGKHKIEEYKDGWKGTLNKLQRLLNNE